MKGETLHENETRKTVEPCSSVRDWLRAPNRCEALVLHQIGELLVQLESTHYASKRIAGALHRAFSRVPEFAT